MERKKCENKREKQKRNSKTARIKKKYKSEGKVNFVQRY